MGKRENTIRNEKNHIILLQTVRENELSNHSNSYLGETSYNKLTCRVNKCLNKLDLGLNTELGFKCSWGLDADHYQTFA